MYRASEIEREYKNAYTAYHEFDADEWLQNKIDRISKTVGKLEDRSVSDGNVSMKEHLKDILYDCHRDADVVIEEELAERLSKLEESKKKYDDFDDDFDVKDISGIGDSKETELWNKFENRFEIAKASVEDVSTVSGISADMAEELIELAQGDSEW